MYINEQIDANLNDLRKTMEKCTCIYALSGLGRDRTASGVKNVKNED